MALTKRWRITVRACIVTGMIMLGAAQALARLPKKCSPFLKDESWSACLPSPDQVVDQIK